VRIALLGAGLLLGTFLLSPLGTVDASHVCDPYPLGYCGTGYHAHAQFCWVKVNGLYVNATQTTGILSIGGASGVAIDTGEDGLFYVRTAPIETFVDDPMEAPLPNRNVLYQEDNNWYGFQPQAFKCSDWVWFPECEPAQWMGPVLNVTKDPDSRLL
jgi:hypothetical protein